MEAKISFLHVFEKLEGFIGKLPGGLQKPILQEIIPLKDLFLRQRAPRFILTGDPAVSSAGLFNAIFSAPVAPFAPGPQADAVPAADGWQDFSHGGQGVLRLLDGRTTPPQEPLVDASRVALAAEQPDMFLFLTVFPGTPGGAARLNADLDRLETLLELSARTHAQSPSVFGLVVSHGEAELSAAAMDSARVWLHAALIARAKIAPRLAPTLDVGTFMRFRLDGSFDPESDRRRNVTELVNRLVAELPNEARLEMARLSGAREAQAKIAQTLVKSISAISGALGAQPIPLADLPFLLTFQVAMVAGIIYISGQNLSAKLATEFLGTMGINLGVGLALREGARAAARAAAKLVFPGLGNVVSGLVASGGTYAIGRAAVAYYIEGATLGDARKLLKQESNLGRRLGSLLGGRRKTPSQAATATLPPGGDSAAHQNGDGAGTRPES